MNKEACGNDVCVDIETIKSAPHCPHGPTLLFERYVDHGKKSVRRFYACSASRDRKYCGFYQLVDDKNLKRKSMEEEMKENDWISFPYTQQECFERLTRIKSLKPHKRHLCKTCGLLLFSCEVKVHNGHCIQSLVTDIQLLKPTRLLQALSNNHTSAQFLFSDKTITFFKDLIQEIDMKRLLCIGTPRLYEALVGEIKMQNRPKCLLIDIDRRFEQFYRPHEFCRYNMFNHHFFDGSSSDIYLHFVQDPLHSPNDLLVVIDPPFGGLVEVLALSLLRIGQDIINDQTQHGDYLPQTLWVFPYFTEARIVKKLPSFTMLDYRVEYENSSNRSKGGNKIGTMARIFTNLDPSTVVLPSSEGYRFCSICKKYIAAENKHCAKCKACTTKAGNTYKHCDLCDKCVKPSWQHCEMCGMCEVPGQHSQLIQIRGCHNCGQMDHKRQNCPSREISSTITAVSDRSDKKRKRQSGSKVFNKKTKQKNY